MAKERFTTPVGRLVQGDLDEPQTKDAQGALRVVKSGPNAGQPNPQYFIAVAFPKADPQGEFGQFYGILARKAAQDFPNLFPNAAAGDYTCSNPQFAWKVIDGDSLVPNQNGRLWSSYEGMAGHWVVRMASGYPPRIYDAGKYGPHDQIQDKGFIKRGYYVRVSGTVEGNGNTQKPGLYVNLDMVERAAFGPEIHSGPDAGEAFGGGPAALPPGATAAPVGGPAPNAPPVPAAAPPSPAAASPAPANPAAAPPAYDGYMAPSPTPAATPVAPVAPAASPAPPAATAPPTPIASPSSPPAAPPAPPAAPPAPGRTMTAAANGATYEACIAAGWTDETLVANGMMLA